jgi:hypothetical protein
MRESGYRRGIELEIVFVDNFNTRLMNTIIYNKIAYLHNLQITRAHTTYFPACSVFNSRFRVTVSDSGDTSASALTPFPAGHCLANELNSN